MKSPYRRFIDLLLGRKPEVPVLRPIFIVGCGRSGTALLFNLLGACPELVKTTGHPDGEDHVGWIEHGGARIAGLANPHGDSGHVGHNLCLHMNESHLTDQIRTSMHRYYSLEVLKGRSSARVLNKCPHLSNKLRYVRAIFPDALFLHIVRDPVAVVASWVKVMQAVPELLMYWPETDFPCWWVFPTRDTAIDKDGLVRESRWYPGAGPVLFADYWTSVNAHISKQLSDTPAQLLTVRYEDLVAQPARVLRQVTDFCGLQALSGVPLQIEEERNRVYRSLLTKEDEAAIIARCRATARQFGYTLPEATAA